MQSHYALSVDILIETLTIEIAPVDTEKNEFEFRDIAITITHFANLQLSGF